VAGDLTAGSDTKVCRPAAPQGSRGGGASGAVPAGTAEGPNADVDLYIATIDGLGRLPLRQAALNMGWSAGDQLHLTLQDSVLRLTAPRSSREPSGIGVALDGRHRALLPYGLRITTGFQAGLRLIVLTVRHAGVVAAVPVSHLIDALVDG
jgi:hypothetical protein